jgi:hypothetical protein
MKILMYGLKKYLSEFHEVHTVRDMHWNGIKNGQLLSLLSQNNFKCWIVVDKNIPYQQNVSNLPCLIIVLNVLRNTLQHLLPLIPSILQNLQQEQTNRVIVIDKFKIQPAHSCSAKSPDFIKHNTFFNVFLFNQKNALIFAGTCIRKLKLP